MSDSVWPHRRQPSRLPHPWDSPGKNTGVGCHFLLQCMKVKSESEVSQSCLTLSDPMDCSPLGSSVHGIFQARTDYIGPISPLVNISFYSEWNRKLLSCVRLSATPWTAAYQVPPSMGFSRPEYWSGLPFPSPGDLPTPGIKATSPALHVDSLPIESFSSVQFSRSVMSISLWPHGLQHARPPRPSPTPGVHSNSCPLSRWCHPTISSSVVPFSSYLQPFPASRFFLMSQLFTSGGQNIGASASVSVLSMNIQGWFPDQT